MAGDPTFRTIETIGSHLQELLRESGRVRPKGPHGYVCDPSCT